VPERELVREPRACAATDRGLTQNPFSEPFRTGDIVGG
jgi:hypothetical protein